MKQIVQNYRTGELWLEDIPVPICKPGHILVRNEFSLVSTGTEKMKVSQARMSLVEKAKARPDQVKQVLQNVTQHGVKATFNKVQERLSALSPLGYSSAGIVVETGSGIDHLHLGDRVACAGEGLACHAEFVLVPKNLCAKIPDQVSSRHGAFSTVGAIAMNGVRQAKVGLGDSVLVIGLGLVGLLAIQLLRAAGCRVIGVDVDESKLALAKTCGAHQVFQRDDENLPTAIAHLTQNNGVDCVYIAASAPNADPMDLAGELARDRATVVVVGMIPVHADWRVYYGKELSIVMARSYGPGRYDRNFEQKGIDYPIGYVPWTQRRNLEEFLRLIEEGAIDPARLAAAEFELEQAPQAYQEMHDAPGKHAVGMLFRYPENTPIERKINTHHPKTRHNSNHPGTGNSIRVGVIGAGNFTTATLIPALKQSQHTSLHAICSATGLSAKSAANRHEFRYATSDATEIFQDPEIDAVIIATRHDSHADFACQALRQGKHVFVEKPLALNDQELQQLIAAAQASSAILMPGFNRRFSPLSQALRDFFPQQNGPVEIICRVNAGAIEKDSWYQDAEEGGWRIVSEGCHFIDLISYLGQSLPTSVSAMMVGGDVQGGQHENCMATLALENGSIASLVYVANGDAGFEKERIEVFGQGRAGVIENWQSVKLSQQGKLKKIRPAGTGKGHQAEIDAFIAAIRGQSPSPISLESAVRTTQTTFKIRDGLIQGGFHQINPSYDDYDNAELA